MNNQQIIDEISTELQKDIKRGKVDRIILPVKYNKKKNKFIFTKVAMKIVKYLKGIANESKRSYIHSRNS